MDVVMLREGAIMVGRVECLHARLRPEPNQSVNSNKRTNCTRLAGSLLGNKFSISTHPHPATSKAQGHTIPLTSLYTAEWCRYAYQEAEMHPLLLTSPGTGLSLAELAVPVFLEELVVFPKQERTVPPPQGSPAIDF